MRLYAICVMYACPGPGGPDSVSFGSLFFVRPEKGLVFSSRKYPASHPMSRFESQKARDYIWPNLLGTFESFVDIRCQAKGPSQKRFWGKFLGETLGDHTIGSSTEGQFNW